MEVKTLTFKKSRLKDLNMVWPKRESISTAK